MSILVPVVSKGVTLNELPDKIAVYFEIGECVLGCKGCHSPHLQVPVPHKMTLEEMCNYAELQIERGANSLVLMGGTTNSMDFDTLKEVIDALSIIAPLGLYSGSDDEEVHKRLADTTDLTWLKTGSYQDELGGLRSPTSNQKFYKRVYKHVVEHGDNRVISYMQDITDTFLTDKEV